MAFVQLLVSGCKVAQCERKSVVSSLSGFDREGTLSVGTKNGKGLRDSTSTVENAEFGIGWSK
jgi:hypothetical protein